jgi:uncharacterized protein (TIGR02266 family)
MAKDTRKDPRAKVLTMTVRYKSATLDEFIEHHSYDVSRGGMFIKTPSPFPPGTLLKFEVKIAEDHRVMQGVGRVVWKRESSEAGSERPAGMGVKFIKIDDDSKRVIDRLVTNRGDAIGAYDQGASEAGVPVSMPPPATTSQPAPAPSATAPRPIAAGSPSAPRPATPAPAAVRPEPAKPEAGSPRRKATMMGLGSLVSQSAAQSAAAAAATPSSHPPPAAPASSSGGGFFPQGAGPAELPPPEDRTVMKQAAELLQDALRQAGGSMDEVGVPGAKAVPQEAAPLEPSPPAPAAAAAAGAAPGTLKDAGEEALTPVDGRPAAAARAELEHDTEPAPPSAPTPARDKAVASAPAAERPARAQVPSSPPAKSGGGRAVALLFSVAAVGGLVWFMTRQQPAESAPETVTEPPVQAAPAPVPTPEPPPVVEEAAAPPAPEAGAGAADAAAAAPAPTAEPTPPPAPAPKPAPAAAPAPKPRPKPKPAPETSPSTAETAKPAETATTPAPKPTAETPPAETAPKPKPKPKSDTDNPY